MRRSCTAWAVLAMLGLAGLSASGDEARKAASPAASEPDPGFLEFLGSIDRLADVSPAYLAQLRNRAARPPLTARYRVPPGPLPATPPPVAPPPGSKE